MKKHIVHLAKEQEKQRKQRLKQELERQRKYYKFLKEVGVSPEASDEEIDDKIINYVAKKWFSHGKIEFLDRQKNNPYFLAQLYNASQDTAIEFPPDPNNKILQNDVDFMLCYVHHAYPLHAMLNDQFEDAMEETLKHYYETCVNPEFVEKLTEIYSDLPIIAIMNNIVDLHIMFATNENYKKGMRDFNDCIKALPYDLVKKQVKDFGERIIKVLPRDVEGFNEFYTLATGKDFNEVKRISAAKKAVEKQTDSEEGLEM